MKLLQQLAIKWGLACPECIAPPEAWCAIDHWKPLVSTLQQLEQLKWQPWLKWLSASVVNIQVEIFSHVQTVRNPLKPEPAAEQQARAILNDAFGVAAFWQSSRQEHRQADLARPPEGCVWHFLLLASIILRSESGNRDLLFACRKKDTCSLISWAGEPDADAP